MEENLKLPGRGAGPTARAKAVNEALANTTLTEEEQAIYTYVKLDKVIAKLTLKVSKINRQTGNVQMNDFIILKNGANQRSRNY